MSCTIRPATMADVDVLVDFTLREARDAEGVTLDPVRVRRGVSAAFAEPPLARYWMAAAPDGRLVGSLSVITEWSNFHGGHYWWVQSLFVVPEARGRGVAAALIAHAARLAHEAQALDLRLYAHQDNARAIRLYERCGFTPAPYVLMRRRS
jgi:GNAT superfamily N-acetyltransferase